MMFFMMVVFNNGEWIIENGELNWMEGVLLWRMFFMMVVFNNGEWIIENGELNWMEGVLEWRIFFMMVVFKLFFKSCFWLTDCSFHLGL